MEIITPLFEERIIGFILAILLLYSAIKLIKVLKNKETALSMIFLHKKRIKSLFLVLIIASFFTFLTGLLYMMEINVLLVEIALDINVFCLFIFTYFLQELMSGDESQ